MLSITFIVWLGIPHWFPFYPQSFLWKDPKHLPTKSPNKENLCRWCYNCSPEKVNQPFSPMHVHTNSFSMFSTLPLETARFNFATIKSARAYNASGEKCHLSHDSKWWLCCLFLAVYFTLAGNFLTNTNTRFDRSAQSAHPNVSACLLFFLGQATPLIVSLHPASFSTCAGCTPGPQTRLYVFPALATCHTSLPVFLPHHPGNLTTVFALLLYNLSPTRLICERPADAARSRQKHPEAVQATSFIERWSSV